MTQNNELLVSMTLGESAWRAIVDLLYHACQLRGGDWIRWQREMAQFISGAIETARVPDKPYLGDDGDIDDSAEWEDHLHDFHRDEEAASSHYS